VPLELTTLAIEVRRHFGFSPIIETRALRTEGHWEFVGSWAPTESKCPDSCANIDALYVWHRLREEHYVLERPHQPPLRAWVCRSCRKAFSTYESDYPGGSPQASRVRELQREFHEWLPLQAAEISRLERDARIIRRREAERLAREEAERLAREEAERLAREEAKRSAQLVIHQMKLKRVNRFCHFTKEQSLSWIILDGAIYSTSELTRRPSRGFEVNDEQRHDNHLNYVCCSVEYPNVRFLNTLSQNPSDEFVALILDPYWTVFEQPDVKFCAVNAAEGSGSRVAPGVTGFDGMYENPVRSTPMHAQFRTFNRGRNHPTKCPTYIQAEVLVRELISVDFLTAVVVGTRHSESKVKRLLARHSLDDVPVHYLPDFFDRERIETGVFERGEEILFPVRDVSRF